MEAQIKINKISEISSKETDIKIIKNKETNIMNNKIEK